MPHWNKSKSFFLKKLECSNVESQERHFCSRKRGFSKFMSQLRDKKAVALQKKVGHKTRGQQGCKSQGSSSSLASQKNKMKSIFSLSFPNNFQPFASFQLNSKELTPSVFLQG